MNEAAIAPAQMRSNCLDGWSCKDYALELLRNMSRGARRLAAHVREDERDDDHHRLAVDALDDGLVNKLVVRGEEARRPRYQ